LFDLASGEKTMPEQLEFTKHRFLHASSVLVLVIHKSLPCHEVPTVSGHQPELGQSRMLDGLEMHSTANEG